jgi:hypothetical protein
MCPTTVRSHWAPVPTDSAPTTETPRPVEEQTSCCTTASTRRQNSLPSPTSGSAIPYAVSLAERGGVATLALIDHDPNRTDEALDEVVHGIVGTMRVVAGVERAVLEPAPCQRIG